MNRARWTEGKRSKYVREITTSCDHYVLAQFVYWHERPVYKAANRYCPINRSSCLYRQGAGRSALSVELVSVKARSIETINALRVGTSPEPDASRNMECLRSEAIHESVCFCLLVINQGN